MFAQSVDANVVAAILAAVVAIVVARYVYIDVDVQLRIGTRKLWNGSSAIVELRRLSKSAIVEERVSRPSRKRLS